MAHLISSIEDLQKHLTVSANFDFNLVLPYAKRADRKYIIPCIGMAQYAVIVAHNYNEETNATIDQVKILFEEAAAHYCLLLAIPFLELKITNYGIKKTDTSNSSNSDWKDIRDLKRYLIDTATEAIDAAMEIMEDNASDFLPWKNSDLFTVFKKNIIRHTKEFQESFDINNSRQTFLSLQPTMNEVEEQYLLPMLGQCTLDFIKEVSADPIVIRAQKLTRLAVGSLTVAKVALTGKFLFTATSMQLKTDEMPWEKTKIELSETALNNLHASRQNAGEEYLKLIKSILVENPTVFTCYEDLPNENLSRRIVNRKSHLSL